ncbi:hypothetical protein F383_22672 [Gossypium arboreum]|uniref:Uncharacterized protein n=1 Tax=Gossypium arboreum TaxID=29729 RepID=A0A0B0P1K5_GOSAR|nr:hypothetical protein F383_22672 [Gossypium arboreum]
MILKRNVEEVKGKSLGHVLGGIDNLNRSSCPIYHSVYPQHFQFSI